MTIRHLPPSRLNLCLLLLASCVNGLMLILASHAPWWAMLPAAVVFALSNNTLFSLLHEAVHGSLFSHPAANRWGGRYAALWFPTGFAIQQTFHLVHHRNNRSPAEQFDVLHSEDIRWLKYAQWYCIFSGLYWLIACVGIFLYALTPKILRHGLLTLFGSQAGLQTSADNYIGALDHLPAMASRLEILAAALWQLALYYLLDLSFTGWLACYATFALLWSSLQYSDHAFSPLDAEKGAGISAYRVGCA